MGSKLPHLIAGLIVHGLYRQSWKEGTSKPYEANTGLRVKVLRPSSLSGQPMGVINRTASLRYGRLNSHMALSYVCVCSDLDASLYLLSLSAAKGAANRTQHRGPNRHRRTRRTKIGKQTTLPNLIRTYGGHRTAPQPLRSRTSCVTPAEMPSKVRLASLHAGRTTIPVIYATTVRRVVP